MRFFRLVVLVGLLTVCRPSLPAAEGDDKSLYVVREGKPQAVLVLPERPTKAEKEAAEELQTYVKQVSGASLEILGEGDASAQGPDRSTIALGNTALAGTAGVGVSSTDPEAFRIVRRGNIVYLLGGNKPGYAKYYSRCLGSGIEFAAYEFLERTCGVRWLRPGPDGTHIPKRKTISVGSMDIEQAPSYQYRRFGYWYEGKARWIHGTEQWKHRDGRERAKLNDWMKHNKMNGFSVCPGGHTFCHIVPKSEYAEHPEYFALHKGSREPIGSRAGGWQLCTTHPEVVDRAEAYARKSFERGRLVAAVSPNDGWGFCQCERCRALDDPNWKDDAGNVVISDRIATFVNEVARRVKDDFPDRFVGYSGYSLYREPPRKVKLEPNVMIWLIQRQWYNWIPGYREEFYEFYRRWAKVQPDVFVFSGEFLTHQYRWGTPWSIISLDAEAIQWAARQYKTKSGTAAIQNDWGNNGIKHYVAARLLWNGSRDLNDILDDYCTSMYGKAAIPMRKYWDRFEQGEKQWQEGQKEGVHLLDVVFGMPEIYSPAVLGDCRERLAKAAELADTDWARANVRFAARGFEYTEMTTKGIDAYLRLLKAKEESQIRQLTETLRNTWKRRREFIEEQRNENIVGYGQFGLMVLNSEKYGGQQSPEQRLAFFENIEPEKLRNPGIEENLSGTWWRFSEGPEARWATENPHSGKRCLSIVKRGWMMQFLALVPGRTYRLSGWIRTDDVERAAIRVQNYDRPAFNRFSTLDIKSWMMTSSKDRVFTGTNDWQQVSCEITPEAPEVRIECYVSGNRGEAFFDDFSLTGPSFAMRPRLAK